MKNTNKRFNLLIVQIKGPRTKIMFNVNIDTLVTSLLEKEKCPLTVWVCLVSVSKQQFSVFKQHFTYFNTLFHPYVFPQKFLNNNF